MRTTYELVRHQGNYVVRQTDNPRWLYEHIRGLMGEGEELDGYTVRIRVENPVDAVEWVFEYEKEHFPTRPSGITMLTTEDNRTPIVNGMRLFNYYDNKWGRVAFDAQTLRTGWFDLIHDDGTVTMLNGARVSTKER